MARGAKESVGGVSMKRCGPSNAGVPYTVCLKEAEFQPIDASTRPGYFLATGIVASRFRSIAEPIAR